MDKICWILYNVNSHYIFLEHGRTYAWNTGTMINYKVPIFPQGSSLYKSRRHRSSAGIFVNPISRPKDYACSLLCRADPTLARKYVVFLWCVAATSQSSSCCPNWTPEDFQLAANECKCCVCSKGEEIKRPKSYMPDWPLHFYIFCDSLPTLSTDLYRHFNNVFQDFGGQKTLNSRVFYDSNNALIKDFPNTVSDRNVACWYLLNNISKWAKTVLCSVALNYTTIFSQSLLAILNTCHS